MMESPEEHRRRRVLVEVVGVGEAPRACPGLWGVVGSYLMRTIGMFLTWATYATWLPGDPRGHWSALLDRWGHYVGGRGCLNPGDAFTLERAKMTAAGSEVVLSDDEQERVAGLVPTILDRGRVYALAVEPTHVHLLLEPVQDDVGTLAGKLKSRTSSAVLAARGNPPVRRVWVSGYWVRYLDSEDAVWGVQSYIEDHNRRRGLPVARWDWVRPFGAP